jgi:hypothetical protein
MNLSRLVGLAAALLITATEGAAFSSLPLHTQSVQVATVSVAGEPLTAELPVIVVTAHPHS